MIFHRLGLINKNQRGFTLVELIIAVAITGMIVGAATTTIFQVFSGNARTSNHMTAVKQVQNAGYWISHDAQMAQQEPVIVKVPVTGEPDELQSITLTWTEWGDVITHTVTYTFENDKLWRDYDGEQSLVAQYIDLNIDPDDPTGTKRLTDCEFTDGVLTLTVTATVGGWQPASETRTYEVMRRPGS